MGAEGNILCEHVRVIQRGHHLSPKTIYDRGHYLAVVRRKPGELWDGAPFLQLPPSFRQRQDDMAHASPAVTARWGTSLHSSCSTTNRPSPTLSPPYTLSYSDTKDEENSDALT